MSAPEVRFRPAAPEDDPFFKEMEFATTWTSLDPLDQERLPPEQIREALDQTHEILLARPGNRIIVAEDPRGRPLGLLWFGINRNLITGEEEAWVYNVSVVEAARGQGLGRLLMAHAEELARAGGFPTLGLMVSCHNEPARILYERLAFRPTNVVMRKALDLG
jgi:ribosomal protein S18 acetylase RimI-like enzyme